MIFGNFKFLTTFVSILVIFLPILVQTNANNSANNLQSGQNIFISEVSFGGSKAVNNCKMPNEINNLDENELIKNMCNFDKWIELYNPSENAISLSDYRIVVQNGLNEILSGQIAPKSFLVLSNSNYRYQNTQKIEEDFVPQKPAKKEVENETENKKEIEKENQAENQKLKNSSQNSKENSQNSANSSQNSLQNSNLVSNSLSNSSSLISNSISSSVSNSDISNSNQKTNSANSQTNSIQNSTTNSIQVLPENNTNTTSVNQNVNQNNSTNYLNNFLISQNSTLFDKTNKPNLTIELKNGTVPSKILDFNKNSDQQNPVIQNSNPSNSDSQIFFQINPNSLNSKQKDFILTNFKSILTRNNNQYETLNSNITSTQKQELFDQNIDWKLQKRTETKLNSVLTQGNFANYSLGILHSLSPNNPTIAIKNPQNQIISSRSFTANWNGQNNYSAEFENFNSPPIQATNLYFENTNFGTPGFAIKKEKEIVKIPQNSADLTTNLPINSPRLESLKGLENQQKSQIQTQTENQKVLENSPIQQEKIPQNQSETSLNNLKNNLQGKITVQTPNYELNPSFINQKTAQLDSNTQRDLATKLSQNPVKVPNTVLEENLEKNIELKKEKISQNSKISNNLTENPQIETFNKLWYIHLSEKWQNSENFNNNIQFINQSNYNSINQTNLSYSKNSTHQKTDQSEIVAKTLVKIPTYQNQDNTIKNSTKIIYSADNLVQNNTISEQIFTFKTDSILNFFINLLLLLLAIRSKENKNQNYQKTQTNNQNYSKITNNLNQQLNFSF